MGRRITQVMESHSRIRGAVFRRSRIVGNRIWNGSGIGHPESVLRHGLEAQASSALRRDRCHRDCEEERTRQGPPPSLHRPVGTGKGAKWQHQVAQDSRDGESGRCFHKVFGPAMHGGCIEAHEPGVHGGASEVGTSNDGTYQNSYNCGCTKILNFSDKLQMVPNGVRWYRWRRMESDGSLLVGVRSSLFSGVDARHPRRGARKQLLG